MPIRAVSGAGCPRCGLPRRCRPTRTAWAGLLAPGIRAPPPRQIDPVVPETAVARTLACSDRAPHPKPLFHRAFAPRNRYPTPPHTPLRNQSGDTAESAASSRPRPSTRADEAPSDRSDAAPTLPHAGWIVNLNDQSVNQLSAERPGFLAARKSFMRARVAADFISISG